MCSERWSYFQNNTGIPIICHWITVCRPSTKKQLAIFGILRFLGFEPRTKMSLAIVASLHHLPLPGRRPHINFHVCVLHLKNIHTVVSSLQNLLGIPSLQQLAFSLYHGGCWGLYSYGMSMDRPYLSYNLKRKISRDERQFPH